MATANNQLQFVLSVNNGQFNAAMTSAGQTLQVFNGQLNAVNGTLQTTSQAMQEAGAASLQLQANVSAFGVVAGSIFAKASAGFRQYESAIADLRKVTGQLTQDNLPALDKALTKISSTLPTSREELVSIGTALAQLGFFAKDSEETIVPSLSKIIELVGKVAIATDLSAAEAGQSFGVLKNIFLDGNETVGQTVAKLKEFADVANALSNTTAATAGFVVRFNSIVGATAKSAGLGFNEVAGFGAAIANLGKTADVAGTAIQQLFLKATTKADSFGKALGISGAEFKKQFAAKPNETIIAFFEKLNKASAERRTQLIAQLGVESRATTIIQGLANNINLVREAQETANKAAAEGTSLDAEVAVRLQTLQVQYDLLANSIQKTITDGFKPFAAVFAPVLESVNAFIKANPVLVKTLGIVTVAVAGVLAAIAGLVVGVIAWRVAFAGVKDTLAGAGASLAKFFASLTSGRSTAVAMTQALAGLTTGLYKTVTAANSANTAFASMTKTQQKAVATMKTFGNAVKGIAGGLVAGAAMAAIAVAADNLSNSITGVNDGLVALGKDVKSVDLRKFAEQGQEAVDKFNNSIAGSLMNLLTFGKYARDRQRDLDALRQAADEMDATITNAFSNFLNPPSFDGSPLTKAQLEQQKLAEGLKKTFGTDIAGQAKTVDLVSRAFTQMGDDGLAALKEIKEALKLTDAQALAYAKTLDDLKGRTPNTKGALVGMWNSTKVAAEAANDSIKVGLDLADRVKDVAAKEKKDREDNIKIITDQAAAQRLLATEAAGGGFDRQLAVEKLKTAAAERQLDIKKQIAAAEMQAAELAGATGDDLIARENLEKTITALQTESYAIEVGLAGAISKTLAGRNAIAKELQAAVDSLHANVVAEKERRAATLEYAATVAVTEQKAVSLRRQAANASIAIVKETLALELAENERALTEKYGEAVKKTKLFQDQQAAIAGKAQNKINTIEDKLQQERQSKILEANKELQAKIKASSDVGSNLVDPDANVQALREIQKEIDNVAVALADPQLKLERIKQLQLDIKKVVEDSTKKYKDAAIAVFDLQTEIRRAKQEQELLTKEAEATAKITAIDKAIDVTKKRGSGEISKREADVAIAAAKRQAQIEMETAKAKQDGIVTDKEQDAITKARLRDAELGANTRTKAGRAELALQKEKINIEAELSKNREKLGDTEQKAKRKEYDDQVKLAELQKAAGEAQANLAAVNATQAELESQRITTLDGVITREKAVTAERQKQYDLSVKQAEQTATPNAGNSPAASKVTAPVSSAPAPTATPAAATTTLPANLTDSLAGVNASTTQLTGALTAAGNSIVSAATTLKNTSNTVGANIETFTSKTTESLNAVSESLQGLNKKVDKAVNDISNIQSNIAKVGA